MDARLMAVGALFAILVVAVAAWRLRSWFDRLRMQRRFSRGRIGELQAADLLKQKGYRVVDEQVSRETGVWVDGRWRPVKVRADYLVERAGKKYVVEVKTGKTATNPTSTATRRQLLEYDQVYDTDGLLLADMERKRIRRIWFEDIPVRRLRYQRRPLGWFYAVVGLLVGISLGMVLYRILVDTR